jgi:hypothetical protein
MYVPLPVPFIHLLTRFLVQRKDVVRALHAEAKPESWIECRHAIHSMFQTRVSNSSIVLLPKILEKIPVLIFAGDQDLICNYMGLEAMIQAMSWNGYTGFGVSLGSFLIRLAHFSRNPIGCSNAVLECEQHACGDLGFE